MKPTILTEDIVFRDVSLLATTKLRGLTQRSLSWA